MVKEKKKKYEEFSTRLQAIRSKLGMTQRELGHYVGLSGPTISQLENSKHAPNFEFMYRIHAELNVNLYYLLFGEGDMFEDRDGPLGLQLEKLAGTHEDIRQLLEYFDRSPILRYSILSKFRGILLMEKNLMDEEIEDIRSQSPK